VSGGLTLQSDGLTTSCIRLALVARGVRVIAATLLVQNRSIRARNFSSECDIIIVMEYALSDKLDRIFKFAQVREPFGMERSLLRAYVACLTFDELCDAICSTFEANASVRIALRGRLLRLLRLSNGELAERLSLLADAAQSLSGNGQVLRPRVDALLSAIYAWLPLPRRHSVLERWMDCGRTDAANRWLKAMASDAALFDAQAIFNYWSVSRNIRAAKILAYQAEPTFIDKVLAELLAGCTEGWIIAKAALRATSIPDDVWYLLRDKHPASYAYLCAMVGRKLTEAEALSLFHDTSPNILEDERGLVIWSIGQMGLVSALDHLGANLEIYGAEVTALS